MWGIWIEKSRAWMTFDSCDIFWTPSRAVAEAQLKQSSFAGDDGVEIRPFDIQNSPTDGKEEKL